jgi:hypothetical protein
MRRDQSCARAGVRASTGSGAAQHALIPKAQDHMAMYKRIGMAMSHRNTTRQ